MPIDDLTALGQKMREARKNKELTQQELSDLDTLKNPDVSLEDEGVNQMKMLYSSCPPEMRDTLLHHTQETVKELTELSKNLKRIEPVSEI